MGTGRSFLGGKVVSKKGQGSWDMAPVHYLLTCNTAAAAAAMTTFVCFYSGGGGGGVGSNSRGEAMNGTILVLNSNR